MFPGAMQCDTRWERILAPTPGTQDEVMLKKLHSTKNTFSLYARLQTQLAQRPLAQLDLNAECPPQPFVWPPVASDDFYFEDSMRIAAEIENLQHKNTIKSIEKALSLVLFLKQDVYVDKWQSLPILPPCLKKERILQTEKKLKVKYVERFFHDFILKNHPPDENPARSLEMVYWLSRQNREEYGSFLTWVQMEIWFKKAIKDANDDAMGHALAHADLLEENPKSTRRALERVAYMRHFSEINFPDLPTGDAKPIEPQNEFRAHVLFNNIRPFTWDQEAEKEDYIFTL
jgi:hypothetical protein